MFLLNIYVLEFRITVFTSASVMEELYIILFFQEECQCVFYYFHCVHAYVCVCMSPCVRVHTHVGLER